MTKPNKYYRDYTICSICGLGTNEPSTDTTPCDSCQKVLLENNGWEFSGSVTICQLKKVSKLSWVTLKYINFNKVQT